MRKEKNSVSDAINLATAVVFAAFVTVATIIFAVSIPATSGYFNIGETMIYVAALLFGPYVGAFAGGIGSAIADMLLAPVYAPGTFIVKSLEGAIVGILNRKMSMRASHSNWKIFTFSLGIIIGVSLAITGSFYYSGNVELYVGIPPPENPTLIGFIPVEFWYALGGVVAFLIVLMGFKVEPQFGSAILSVIVGGLEMVVGYFLYEQLILNTAALVEVPANIGQMLIGLIVAMPIVKIVQRQLPQLKR